MTSDTNSQTAHDPDQSDIQKDIDGTLMHKIGCQCFLCLAAYNNLTEPGDEDDFRPF